MTTETTLRYLVNDVGAAEVIESLIGVCDIRAREAKHKGDPNDAAAWWRELSNSLTDQPLRAARVIAKKYGHNEPPEIKPHDD